MHGGGLHCARIAAHGSGKYSEGGSSWSSRGLIRQVAPASVHRRRILAMLSARGANVAQNKTGEDQSSKVLAD